MYNSLFVHSTRTEEEFARRVYSEIEDRKKEVLSDINSPATFNLTPFAIRVFENRFLLFWTKIQIKKDLKKIPVYL